MSTKIGNNISQNTAIQQRIQSQTSLQEALNKKRIEHNDILTTSEELREETIGENTTVVFDSSKIYHSYLDTTKKTIKINTGSGFTNIRITGSPITYKAVKTDKTKASVSGTIVDHTSIGFSTGTLTLTAGNGYTKVSISSEIHMELPSIGYKVYDTIRGKKYLQSEGTLLFK